MAKMPGYRCSGSYKQKLSEYSPMHPVAHDRDGQSLMGTPVSFQMLYADGVERLAAESLLEKQK